MIMDGVCGTVVPVVLVVLEQSHWVHQTIRAYDMWNKAILLVIWREIGKRGRKSFGIKGMFLKSV